VVFALLRAGPPYARRPTDLFRALLVTSGAITKQVDRLSTLGLVTRTPEPDGGSGQLVALTPRGREVANRAIEGVATGTFLSRRNDGLQPEERAALLRLSRHLLSVLE
jgi:Transcriptional regulators